MTGVIRYIVTRTYDLNDLTWRSRNSFQCGLRCRLDPFAMFADQVFQPIDCFRFRDVEFQRRLADAEVHLARLDMPCARPARIAVRRRGLPGGPLTVTYLLLATRQLEAADSG